MVWLWLINTASRAEPSFLNSLSCCWFYSMMQKKSTSLKITGISDKRLAKTFRFSTPFFCIRFHHRQKGVQRSVKKVLLISEYQKKEALVMALFQLWNNGYLRLKSRYNKLQKKSSSNFEDLLNISHLIY